MNHVIANQNSQTRLMQQMQKDLAKEVAASLSSSIEPMVAHLDKTMDTFTDTVTLNQEKLLENIAERVARTMKQEFFSEFLEMRKVMSETNQVQRDHLEFIRTSEQKFQTDVLDGQNYLAHSVQSSTEVIDSAMSSLKDQERQMEQFVTDMQKAMNDIAQTNDLSLKMTQQMDHLIEMNDDVADKMMEVAQLSERYTKSLASVQANNSELSEGLSVMNDANIRMTDQIARMNDATVASLEEGRQAQTAYVEAASAYLGQIKDAQASLSGQMQTQQANLREFTEYMTQVLQRMAKLTEAVTLSVKEVSERMDAEGYAASAPDMTQTNAKLDRLVSAVEAMEKRSGTESAPARRKGFFR